MADDLTLQAAAILSDAKWKVHQDDDFHPALDFRVMIRYLEDVPRDLLDQMIATLSGTTSFTGTLTEGKDYAGTWFQGHVWWARQNKEGGKDNQVTVWQCLVKGAGTATTFIVPNVNGATTHTIFHSFTKASLDALLAALSASLENSCGPSFSREEGRWSGSVTTRPGESSKYTKYYNSGFFYEMYDKWRWDHGGRYIKEVWRITCRYRYGSGIALGLLDFHGTSTGTVDPTGGDNPPGTRDGGGAPLMEWSHFQALGSDKYQFKRTIKAELLTVDQTSIYDISGRGTPTGTAQQVASPTDMGT